MCQAQTKSNRSQADKLRAGSNYSSHRGDPGTPRLRLQGTRSKGLWGTCIPATRGQTTFHTEGPSHPAACSAWALRQDIPSYGGHQHFPKSHSRGGTGTLWSRKISAWCIPAPPAPGPHSKHMEATSFTPTSWGWGWVCISGPQVQNTTVSTRVSAGATRRGP